MSNTNNTPDSITWLNEAVVIRRVRRALAKVGKALHVQRGRFSVLDDQRQPLETDIQLSTLARSLGVIADDERIDPPNPERHWLFYLARESIFTHNGTSYIHLDKLTREYRSEKAARRAGAGIADRTSIVIVSFDPVRVAS